MTKLTKVQADLLAMIKADEELTRWLYYSTQYESTRGMAAISFISKLCLNRHVTESGLPKLRNVIAIIPEFIRTYE